MRLSIDTFSLYKRFGDEKMVQMIKKAGFDAVDYTFSDLDSVSDQEVNGISDG